MSDPLSRTYRITIPAPMCETVEGLAFSQNTSISEIVNRALKGYMIVIGEAKQ